MIDFLAPCYPSCSFDDVSLLGRPSFISNHCPPLFLCVPFMLPAYSTLQVFLIFVLFCLVWLFHATVNLNIWVNWYKPPRTQDTNSSAISEKSFKPLLGGHHPLHPLGQAAVHLSLITTALSSTIEYINSTTHYESFQERLFLFSMMPLRVIQIVMHMNKSFSQLSNVLLCGCTTVCFSVGCWAHVSCFQWN